MMLLLLILLLMLVWGAHLCTVLGGGMPSVTVTRGTGPGLPMMPCSIYPKVLSNDHNNWHSDLICQLHVSCHTTQLDEPT
jgi:hypothetical protein